ncbi:DUF3179 domain-containing (seleno)protein [Arenibacter sp. GZD96]|uniref:DUF3179 domain-containing (seleno)protein n=1 Tax=Aurantibrevibacter litoralis TaxID=3106030 RepID=UPI002AFFF4F5|nr:DUF3179 domain-containing (seleno)protein [Arenibacter sp. GZD-96]MEA1786046.1 DUF3179 domain-containing (seleno)protein [Arenibacter sp. GZD-96]
MKINILLFALMLGSALSAQRPSALDNGKFIVKDQQQLLYGGSEEEHFKIDNLDLKKEQFHYGLGRERFPALLEPNFESVTEANRHWKDEDRFLVAKKGNTVKAYSVKDLTRHEVVNDVLEGEPIFAAYCILADLGAVYKRTYNDKVFTFAVSGYTYFDPKVWDGLDGFILWDRETESLWWPLIDKAVSGDLKGVPLLKLEDLYWEDTTWKSVKNKYPKAEVLITGQDFERPKSWRSYDNVSDVVKNYTQK